MVSNLSATLFRQDWKLPQFSGESTNYLKQPKQRENLWWNWRKKGGSRKYSQCIPRVKDAASTGHLCLKNHNLTLSISVSNDFWVIMVISYKLVGGFNPPEKYARQIGSFPQVGVKIKNIWNHHLVNLVVILYKLKLSTPNLWSRLEGKSPFNNVTYPDLPRARGMGHLQSVKSVKLGW